MENIYATPFSTTVTFSNNTALSPGIYRIFADSALVDAFLISDSKNQNFSILIKKGESIYTNSPENTAYHNYLQHLSTFDQRMQALNVEYQQAQQSMPAYMLQTVVDNLNIQAEKILQEKIVYQKQTVQNHAGTLFASIVAASMEIPQPPQTIQNNRSLLQQFYSQHFFNNFPWSDPRIFHTSIGVNKVKEFCQFIAQCNRPDFNPQVLAYLDSAKVNKESYFAFFDLMEKCFGDHASPFRIETLYIAMLQDMLNYPELTDLRKRHCQYELGVINKNNVGDIVPNFNLTLSDGTKTSLYDIPCDYMLLYLQHPTCPTCQQVRKLIANFPILNRAIASGKLKVLTVYFEDEQEVWDNYIRSAEANPTYLHGWNVDQSIENDRLFDTRAIPYLFLLDKDKRVIVKNVNEMKLEDEIKKLNILN